MNIDAVALLDTLESEKDSYEQLLGLSKSQQEMILSRDLEGLSDVIKATECLMLVARELGDKRHAIISAGAGQGSFDSPLELSSIIKGLDMPLAKKASDLREEMLSIIAELDETNQANADLLRRGINVTNFLLTTIMQDDSPVYTGKPGPQKSKAKIFDGRA